MEAILAVATILGGITALWFLWEKTPILNLVEALNQWRNIKKKPFFIQPKENRIVAKVEWPLL